MRVQRPIRRIRVAADEIDRQTLALAEREKVREPDRPPIQPVNVAGVYNGCVLTNVFRFAGEAIVGNKVAGGWTAHAKLRVYALDGQHTDAVQLEILALRAAK